MKKLSFAAVAVAAHALFPVLLAAQATTPTPAAPAAPAAPAPSTSTATAGEPAVSPLIQALGDSIPPDVAQKVGVLLEEAQKARKENRYTGALSKLEEAEKLAPKVSLIYTMRGDVYLAPRRRDFDLAKEQFLKSLELDSTSPGPRFNLAELEFARHDFPVAAAAFRKLITDFPKLPMTIRHLSLFRIVICEARMKNYDVAEKIIKDSFTFMDDSPAYYLSGAAVSFAKKDLKMANEWMLRAAGIFKEPQLGPYLDAFREMRWIKDVDWEALPDPSAGK
ncbi:MAG: hypothetical protein IPK32_03260 [Verrucomicrobiaceae bacterium]|nr:hypothetical protein [Verrucomicrobiaceae bacterium]